MDIGNQGNMNPGTDLMDGNRGRLIGNGNADHFAARFLQLWICSTVALTSRVSQEVMD